LEEVGFKVKFMQCADPEDCMRLCREWKYVKTTSNTLLAIAPHIDRDCVVLVDDGGDRDGVS